MNLKNLKWIKLFMKECPFLLSISNMIGICDSLPLPTLLSYQLVCLPSSAPKSDRKLLAAWKNPQRSDRIGHLPHIPKSRSGYVWRVDTHSCLAMFTELCTVFATVELLCFMYRKFDQLNNAEGSSEEGLVLHKKYYVAEKTSSPFWNSLWMENENNSVCYDTFIYLFLICLSIWYEYSLDLSSFFSSFIQLLHYFPSNDNSHALISCFESYSFRLINPEFIYGKNKNQI